MCTRLQAIQAVHRLLFPYFYVFPTMVYLFSLVKQDSFEPGSARQHIKAEVNGQQYYPSVEEVLAMLHADHTNAVERLLSGDRSQARDPSPDNAGDLRTGSSPQEQSPVSYYGNGEVSRGSEVTIETSKQRMVEREKLRSEVVGRSQPKLAFVDETKDVTEGVLPTTIRRDSTSGSLSSLDSLEEVPDKVPDPDKVPNTVGAEPAPEVTEGVLRNGTKPRRANRVTFNESVTFNNGFVGILKGKPDTDVSVERSGMEKQKSYFEIPAQENGNGQVGNETQGMEAFCYSDAKPNEAMSGFCQDNSISGHPASVNSTPSTGLGSGFTSQAYNYPFVTATDVTHLRVARTNGPMSKSSQDIALSSRAALVNSTPSTPGSGFTSQANNYSSVTTADLTLRAMSSHPRANSVARNTSDHTNSPAHSGNGYLHQTPAAKSSFLPSRYDDKECGQETANIASSGIELSRQRHFGNAPNSYSEVNGFHIDEQDGGNGVVQGKTPETSSRRVPFSSINASMLKDSLEVNHESMESTAEPRAPRRIPTAMDHARGTSHAEVAPDVPLIPVTKKDFLSKALLRTSDNTVTPLASTGMSSANAGMSSVNTRISSGNTHTSSANVGASSANTVTPSANDFHSRNDSSKQSSMSSYTKTNVPYYGNDSAGNFFPNAKHERERNEHIDDRYSKVYENDVRVIRGTQGNDGITGSDVKTAPKLRTVSSTTNNEALLNRQNGTMQLNNRNTAYNGSPRKTVQAVHEGAQYIATRKRSSSDDLLKTVQEDLERITMLPAQQNVSRAQTSTTAHGRVQSVNVESRRKPVVSDGHGRKLPPKKNGNGLNAKSKDEKKSNSTAKRLHRPAVETGTRKQTATKAKNIQYSSNQNNAQEYQTTNPNLNRVHNRSPAHETAHRSPWTGDENPDTESRPVEPRSAHARQDRKNGAGLVLLDKTPTDEEINTLWETVRTCLKHEQTQKAASDSIVNSVRHSRSTNGPLVGNHYLIDTNRWDPRPVRPVTTNAFGLNSTTASEIRQGTSNGYVSFRRQNSLDSFERKRSGGSNASLPPQRKGSLLEYRSHRAERRVTTRTQEASRAPLNQKYFQALRGPTTSARGPKKSNSVKTGLLIRAILDKVDFHATPQSRFRFCLSNS